MEPKVLINRKQRTVYLIGDVSARMATMFRKYMAALGPDPVTVEINSQGGEVEAGAAIADTIFVHGNVTTLAAGYAMSMGSIILAAGKIRKALRSSVIMVHEGHSVIKGTESRLEHEFAEAKRLQELMWTRLDEYTDKSTGFWKEKADKRNLYLTADEAKTYGIIHEVVG